MQATHAVATAVPSESQKLAMKPTPSVIFWRTFFLFQLYRFVAINLRMIAMIRKSH